MNDKLSKFEKLKEKARQNPLFTRLSEDKSEEVELFWYLEGDIPIVEVKRKNNT